MKSLQIAITTLLLLFPLSGSAAPTDTNSLEQFEERFVNSLPYDPAANETTMRLVGFKRMAVPAEEVASFEAAWNDPPAEWQRRDESKVVARHEEHFWYDRARREIRMYFPVEGALLRRGEGERDFVEADGLGQVEDVTEVLKREVDAAARGRAVVGRKVTDQVSGVEGNVVRDGIIYLSEPVLPTRHLDARTAIYDFGIKSLDHDGHGHDHSDDGGNQKRAEGKKGCLQNHNGINCSKAYKINQGRCPMNPKVCMDYNGFKTDCKKGTTYKFGIPSFTKVVKFVGSDCSVSMARGHCWNEVM